MSGGGSRVGGHLVARDARAPRITPEHLLAALLQDDESRAVLLLKQLGAEPDRMLEVLGRRRSTTAGLDESEVEALRSIGIDAEEVVRRVEAELGAPLQDPGRRTAGHIPFGKGAKKVLELSLREALAVGDKEIGQATLIRFYTLHVIFLPLAAATMMAVHFWRIRKDGGISGPL